MYTWSHDYLQEDDICVPHTHLHIFAHAPYCVSDDPISYVKRRRKTECDFPEDGDRSCGEFVGNTGSLTTRHTTYLIRQGSDSFERKSRKMCKLLRHHL